MNTMSYKVRYDSDQYFAGWKATGWDAIKRIAIWTTDRRKLVLASDQDLSELTQAYGRLEIRTVTT